MYVYRATVVREHDGDTFFVDIDLGWHTWRRDEPLRLAGLDAPELELVEGQAALAWLADKLPVGAVITVLTDRDRREKYGRMLATVWDNDHGDIWGDSINELLVDAGHAKPYSGKGPRP